MNFLIIFYLLGVFFAVYQDFTRREIDDWLNLFLFSTGVLFLGFTQQLFTNPTVLVTFGSFVFIVSLLSFAFYYGRFFSGGDSKLFFALSPLFFTPLLSFSCYNLFFYTILLFVCGSVYSLVYSSYLFFRDFKKVKVVFLSELNKKYYIFLIYLAVIFLFLGFFEKLIFIFSIFIFAFVFLICMAKSLEEISMKRLVSTKNLREGDWLFFDVEVGKKMFRKNWEGLNAKDLKYLKKFNKKIYVKDGIPYAPSFLFALFLFVFRDYLLGIIFS